MSYVVLSHRKGAEMVKGIGHVAFNVKDMDRTIRFYENTMGFKKAFAFRKHGRKSLIRERLRMMLLNRGPIITGSAGRTTRTGTR